ncbi:unnamed protein product [Spirodela intermedia]|uniref:Dof-type domain-containing protein n=1 Tax=Spirodela intermedia TaxID=51605 RepID=A0A7I8KKH0_SPIIN|nr:unnamed protein product [Spirodela intermedia]
MVQGKDPAIKLFGRTIPVVGRRAVGGAVRDSDPSLADGAVGEIKVGFKGRINAAAKEALLEEPHGRDQIESNLPFVEEKEHGEADGSVQEKTLKRPDKILPCPRCNSLDTKFCYYNNYNVNQPRHFCKNCQRYWTAGGTMRNVPVGAGRRRSKPSPPPELVPRRFPAWGSSHGAGLELGPAEMASSESGDSVHGLGDQRRDSEINPTAVGVQNCEEPSENGMRGSFPRIGPLQQSPWMSHWSSMGSSGLPLPPLPPSASGRCSSEMKCRQEKDNSSPLMRSSGPPLFHDPVSLSGLSSWASSSQPPGSSSLGKHSRGPGLAGQEQEGIPLWGPKTPRGSDRHYPPGGSLWVNPDAAEAIEKGDIS